MYSTASVGYSLGISFIDLKKYLFVWWNKTKCVDGTNFNQEFVFSLHTDSSKEEGKEGRQCKHQLTRAVFVEPFSFFSYLGSSTPKIKKISVSVSLSRN